MSLQVCMRKMLLNWRKEKDHLDTVKVQSSSWCEKDTGYGEDTE